jgi:hypothetical protein
VPLPSGSESEQQTIFEKKIQAKSPQISDDNHDTKNVDDTESAQSESDNEGVSSVIESVGVVIDKVINETTDEVDRITSSNEQDDNKKLLETDIDKIDDEIIEILREKSGERDEKLKSELDDATSKNNENTQVDTIEGEIVESEQEIVKISEEEKVSEDRKVEEEKVSKVEEEKPKETIIDEELLPEGAIESYNAEQSNKPPVPIQTYLWEDVKRSKEQVSGNNVCSPVYRSQFYTKTLVHW